LLSAGQARRLGLARLALAERPVWLLDEPSVSLDTASQKILALAVRDHLKGGGIVLAATHVPLGVALKRELKLGGRRSK
jgi:heme exporter protein A